MKHIHISCSTSSFSVTLLDLYPRNSIQKTSSTSHNSNIFLYHFLEYISEPKRQKKRKPNIGEKMGDQGVQQMQQQPVVVYPNAYTKQYPNPSSSSSSSVSNGSFGTVFIVLAVILVLSAMACVFGRLCNRGSRPAKQQHNKHPKHEKGSSKKSREIRPVEREPRERGYLDFGLDMKRPQPSRKPSSEDEEDIEFGFDNKRGERGGGGGGPPPPSIKHGVRFKLPENEDRQAKGESRHGGPEFEFRPGQ